MKLDWWLSLNLIQANPISISEVKCYNNRKTQTPPPGPEPHFIMSFLLEKQRIIIDIYFLGDTAFTVDIVVKFGFNNAITILFWFYCNLLKRNKLIMSPQTSWEANIALQSLRYTSHYIIMVRGTELRRGKKIFDGNNSPGLCVCSS